jgi:hypothetical protein
MTADPRRRAWLATVSALLVVAAFLAAKAGRDAILLARYPITSLPIFIGLSAALSLPVIVIAGKLMMRHGPHRLVPAMNAVSAALAVVEWFAIDRFPRETAVVVFFHLNTASAVLVSGFWSIINERFDIQGAKRHIGRIGMGATRGGIAGGLIAERTAVYFAPDSILLVIAAMQALGAALLLVLGRGATRGAVEADESTWSALGGVARSQLLRKAGIIVVLTAVAATAIDYVFKADIVGGGSHDDLFRSLALFYTATNIITAVVQVTLCGPALAALGVPRTVATLPFALTGFSVLSLLIPLPAVTALARGAELVTRNSIYRAGYELLYASLPPEHKRSTKVVLDVGADKLGDIIAAQLVGTVVYVVADARIGVLVLAVAAGALSVIVGMRLPGSYTQSLEDTLLEKMPAEAPAEPWISLTRMPALGHPGEAVPLQLRRRRKPPPLEHHDTPDHVVAVIRDLRSKDPRRIADALARPLPSEAIPAAIELVGESDDVARVAIAALRRLAPRCTGALVDTLLDGERDERLRRRIPGIIVEGIPDLAVWALWKGMRDPSFQVRYRCAIALSARVGDGRLESVTTDEIFEIVRRELVAEDWKSRAVVLDALSTPEALDEVDVGLAHVFRVLGFALPAEPLRVALRAVTTDDVELRAMALEYLESILPADVRAQIWPLLDEATEARVASPLDEARSTAILARLRASQVQKAS